MHPTIARHWGRYRQRLAAGHAAHGRPEDALRHATAAVQHLQHGTDPGTELVAAYHIVATCQQELGQLEVAVAARRSAIDILERVAPGTTASTSALVELGDLVRLQGHFDEAEEILTRALTYASSEPDGDEPPIRALVLNALGIVHKDTGRYHDAEKAYTEALELITTTCGPGHPAAAPLWHNIAGLAHARGQADIAATAAGRAVRIRERALGPEHHLVAQDLAVHGAALFELGRTDEAEQLFERALAIFRARHPADQYDVAVNISNLAACRLRRNDGAGAEALFRQGLAIKQTILGEHHPEIARQLNNLAVAVADQHRLNEATDLHRQALTIAQHTIPVGHTLTHACAQNLAISRERELRQTRGDRAAHDPSPRSSDISGSALGVASRAARCTTKGCAWFRYAVPPRDRPHPRHRPHQSTLEAIHPNNKEIPMKRSILATAGAVIALALPAAVAGAHNAGHLFLPDGSCHEVGSNKDAPIVGAGNPNQSPGSNNLPGQLDLIPGNGDQYGARWAAERSATLLPGNCP